MRRDRALRPLSHDHQHGLAIALQLKRATPETFDEARTAFVEYWEEEGRQHFRTEEEVLLPVAARWVPPAHDAVVRVLVEHLDLRRRAAAVSLAVPDLEDLRALGDRLQAHIRHEERVLFPLIEDALPNGELAELTTALERVEQRG